MSDWLIDDVFVVAMSWVCIILMLICLGMLCWCFWCGFRDWLWSPATFELRVDEWVCAKSHEEIVTVFLPVGKVIVPTQHVVTIVDRYERRR